MYASRKIFIQSAKFLEKSPSCRFCNYGLFTPLTASSNEIYRPISVDVSARGGEVGGATAPRSKERERHFDSWRGARGAYRSIDYTDPLALSRYAAPPLGRSRSLSLSLGPSRSLSLLLDPSRCFSVPLALSHHYSVPYTHARTLWPLHGPSHSLPLFLAISGHHTAPLTPSHSF